MTILRRKNETPRGSRRNLVETMLKGNAPPGRISLRRAHIIPHSRSVSRDDHRQHHRNRKSLDRECLYMADDAALFMEGHGHEHGAQDEADCDHGTADIIHGFFGGWIGLRPFPMWCSSFHHDDCVVHDEPRQAPRPHLSTVLNGEAQADECGEGSYQRSGTASMGNGMSRGDCRGR